MLILKENHPERKRLEHLTDIISPSEAQRAEIRAIRLGVLNLMPLMDETENDILQSIGNSILQIEPIWLKVATRKKNGRNTSLSHINQFYMTLEEATKRKNLDGLIITGAPIELLDFQKVEYWKEMEKIFDYARDHVYSSLFLCWAAMAGAYHYYNIGKVTYPNKLAGIFTMNNCNGDNHQMTKGMNPLVKVCQSRYTDMDQDKLLEVEEKGEIVRLLESSETPISLEGRKIGVTAFASRDISAIYNLGHLEYHERTLDQEVKRDLKASSYPVEHYYSDPKKKEEISPISWKSERTLFYMNYINVIYNLMNQTKKRHQAFSM